MDKWGLLNNKVEKVKKLYHMLEENYGSNKVSDIWHEIKKIESEISHLIHQH